MFNIYLQKYNYAFAKLIYIHLEKNIKGPKCANMLNIHFEKRQIFNWKNVKYLFSYIKKN